MPNDWMMHQAHINLLVLCGFWLYMLTRDS